MTGTQHGTVGLLVVFPYLGRSSERCSSRARQPGARLTSGVQHFAAGAMLAGSASTRPPVLRLPVSLSARRSCSACASWRRTPAPQRTLGRRRGILVGLSVATLGRAQGVALTIALTLVIVPLALALSVSGELSNRGAGVIKAALIPPRCLSAWSSAPSERSSCLALHPRRCSAGLLAFGLAALLFLVAEELLVEAHETVDPPRPRPCSSSASSPCTSWTRASDQSSRPGANSKSADRKLVCSVLSEPSSSRFRGDVFGQTGRNADSYGYRRKWALRASM